MRTYLFAISSLVAACSSDSPTAAPDGGEDPAPDASVEPPPANGFRVTSPDVTIMPGQEITYCYYFRTPNTDTVVVKKWSSAMTPGSHHVIMYTTATDAMPPGTLSDSGCGAFGGSNLPSWTYAAQTPTASLELPTDDGNGLPLGQEIAPGTPAYFQMHYLNTTDDPIVAHVTLDAEGYAAGVAYTKTAPYVTYNASISIPPGATDHVETMSCTVPAGLKFWQMSTHSHKQSIDTEIKDGTAVAFASNDWEHPGAVTWMGAPFYEFASGKLTYECTYDNTGDNANTTVTSGPSADTDEMCMAIGYYFPATKTLMCLNSVGPL